MRFHLSFKTKATNNADDNGFESKQIRLWNCFYCGQAKMKAFENG